MIFGKLRTLFTRASRHEHDANEELRFHLEKEIEKNIAAGLSPDEARRQALIAFGGVTQIRESLREVHRIQWLEVLRQDSALRLAHATKVASIYDGSCAHASAGYWRQYSDLQPD